jgi:hypothetical protein
LIAFLGVAVEVDCSSLADEVVPNERYRACQIREAASGSRARTVVRRSASGVVFMTSICDGTVEVYRCDRLMCDVSVQVSVDPTFWERSRVEDQDHVTHGRERVSSKAIEMGVSEV